MSIKKNKSPKYVKDFQQVLCSLKQIIGIAFQLDAFKAEKLAEKELINRIDFFSRLFLLLSEESEMTSTPLYIQRKGTFPNFKLRYYGTNSICPVRMERENMSGRRNPSLSISYSGSSASMLYGHFLRQQFSLQSANCKSQEVIRILQTVKF